MKRIRKQTARKLYNLGFAVTLNPCKCKLNNHWFYTECVIEKPNNGDFYTKSEINFDSVVNKFEAYNCNNETGKYTAYYFPETITVWYQIDTANPTGYRDTIDIQLKRLNKYLKNYKMTSIDNCSKFNDIYFIKFTEKSKHYDEC